MVYGINSVEVLLIAFIEVHNVSASVCGILALIASRQAELSGLFLEESLFSLALHAAEVVHVSVKLKELGTLSELEVLRIEELFVELNFFLAVRIHVGLRVVSINVLRQKHDVSTLIILLESHL